MDTSIAARIPPRKFLVVDDDEAFRTRLVKAIQKRGLEAHGAASAAEAVQMARARLPHAAVVDLRMPGTSGLDLVPQLAELVPGIQVVVLTGYGSIATAVEAVRRGALDYLQKPLDADQILAAFDREGSADGAGSAAGTSSGASVAGGAGAASAVGSGPPPTLARVEWEHIQRILHDCNGNISLAARKLGLHRRSLQRKLGKLPPLE